MHPEALLPIQLTETLINSYRIPILYQETRYTHYTFTHITTTQLKLKQAFSSSRGVSIRQL